MHFLPNAPSICSNFRVPHIEEKKQSMLPLPRACTDLEELSTKNRLTRQSWLSHVFPFFLCHHVTHVLHFASCFSIFTRQNKTRLADDGVVEDSIQSNTFMQSPSRIKDFFFLKPAYTKSLLKSCRASCQQEAAFQVIFFSLN